RTVPVDENRMPTEVGAINGGMMKRTSKVRSPTIAIQVDSVDEYVQKVEAAGGKLIEPKMEIPGMGYYAYVQDTEGNLLGLWEPMC
ncbi:MAG TPA: VOC family protein, partial [Candidatus Babeliaceae bacterium]|nr:VOC family protein [Candidatus Babeliaceae bacterium]